MSYTTVVAFLVVVLVILFIVFIVLFIKERVETRKLILRILAFNERLKMEEEGNQKYEEIIAGYKELEGAPNSRRDTNYSCVEACVEMRDTCDEGFTLIWYGIKVFVYGQFVLELEVFADGDGLISSEFSSARRKNQFEIVKAMAQALRPHMMQFCSFNRIIDPDDHVSFDYEEVHPNGLW